MARITTELLGITLCQNKCYRYYDWQTVSISHYNFMRKLCEGYLGLKVIAEGNWGMPLRNIPRKCLKIPEISKFIKYSVN